MDIFKKANLDGELFLSEIKLRFPNFIFPKSKNYTKSQYLKCPGCNKNKGSFQFIRDNHYFRCFSNSCDFSNGFNIVTFLSFFDSCDRRVLADYLRSKIINNRDLEFSKIVPNDRAEPIKELEQIERIIRDNCVDLLIGGKHPLNGEIDLKTALETLHIYIKNRWGEIKNQGGIFTLSKRYFANLLNLDSEPAFKILILFQILGIIEKSNLLNLPGNYKKPINQYRLTSLSYEEMLKRIEDFKKSNKSIRELRIEDIEKIKEKIQVITTEEERLKNRNLEIEWIIMDREFRDSYDEFEKRRVKLLRKRDGLGLKNLWLEIDKKSTEQKQKRKHLHEQIMILGPLRTYEEEKEQNKQNKRDAYLRKIK